MSTLYVMVGIPASGKSTATAALVEKGAVVISSDLIRKELFGDENTQYTEEWLKDQNYDGAPDTRSKEVFSNGKVFDLVFKTASEKLGAGTDVILDSTACSRNFRRRMLDHIKNADRRVCLVMAVSFEVCCARNRQRERVVPDEAMKRIAGNFEFPSEAEGFDEIVYYGDKNDIDYGEAGR